MLTLQSAIAASIAAGLLLQPVEAHAVERKCKKGVCSRTTWDGTRVNIYFETDGPSLATHFNFKGNNAQGVTGQQLEIRTGNYSFSANNGESGKYFLQACHKRPMRGSDCTPWANFTWEAKKKKK